MMSDRPRGCLVVSAATSSALDNDAVRTFLAERRRAQETSLVERLRQAVSDGELPKETDPEVLGGAIAALLIGISMQARDGASKQKLRAMCVYSIPALFGDASWFAAIVSAGDRETPRTMPLVGLPSQARRTLQCLLCGSFHRSFR
jgi:hypothetical protein